MAWAKLGFSKDGSSGWWKSRAKPLKLCSSLCSAPLKSQPFVWGFAASTRTTDRGFYTTAPGLSITSTHPPGYSSQLMLCRKHTLNIKHLLVAKRLLQVDLWAKDLTAGRRAALKGGKECIPKKLGEYRLGILRKSWKICWLSTAWALVFFVPLAFLCGTKIPSTGAAPLHFTCQAQMLLVQSMKKQPGSQQNIKSKPAESLGFNRSPYGWSHRAEGKQSENNTLTFTDLLPSHLPTFRPGQ